MRYAVCVLCQCSTHVDLRICDIACVTMGCMTELHGMCVVLTECIIYIIFIQGVWQVCPRRTHSKDTRGVFLYGSILCTVGGVRGLSFNYTE